MAVICQNSQFSHASFNNAIGNVRYLFSGGNPWTDGTSPAFWARREAAPKKGPALLLNLRILGKRPVCPQVPPRFLLCTSLWEAEAAQEVLKARVGAKGIQLGVGGDPGRAVRALVEGFSQP